MILLPLILWQRNYQSYCRSVAYQPQVQLDFSRPGTPIDDAYIGAFNGTLRRECLNTQWFLSVEEAQEQLTAWLDQVEGEPASPGVTGSDARRICQSSCGKGQDQRSQISQKARSPPDLKKGDLASTPLAGLMQRDQTW